MSFRQSQFKQGLLSPKKEQKQEAEKGWDISPITIGDYLKGLEEGEHLLPIDAEFTNLRHALRDPHEIAEIAAATGEQNINKLITYPPNRLALFETVSFVETELCIETDEELLKTVQDIYRNHVKAAIKSNKLLKIHCECSAQEMALKALEESKDDAPYYQLAQQLKETILKRYQSGTYKPHTYLPIYDSESNEAISSPEDAINEITFWAVSDKIYQEIALNKVNAIIEPLIHKIIDADEKSYPRLSTHESNNRHTFILAGAPACGKGTATGLIMVDAEKTHNINWNDLVKINTDVHRHIVSNDAITGEEKEMSVRLNGDEASVITDRAYARIRKKIADGRAPHLLIDGANPSIERLEIATAENGTAHLVVVTVPVDVSIERAYERGLKTHRYVMTDYMLNAHRSISADLFNRLALFKGKNIEFIIFNTNVPFGDPPQKLMFANMADGVAYVFDKNGMAKFCGKKNINLKVKSNDELFKSVKDKTSDDYIMQIENAGMKITYLQQEKQSSHGKSPKLTR